MEAKEIEKIKVIVDFDGHGKTTVEIDMIEFEDDFIMFGDYNLKEIIEIIIKKKGD